MNNEENLKCLFTGQCYRYKYDYYVIFDGTVMKADYCYEPIGFQSSYCVIENKTFYNVKFLKEIINREEYTTQPIGFIVLFIVIMYLIYRFVYWLMFERY